LKKRKLLFLLLGDYLSSILATLLIFSFPRIIAEEKAAATHEPAIAAE